MHTDLSRYVYMSTPAELHFSLKRGHYFDDYPCSSVQTQEGKRFIDRSLSALMGGDVPPLSVLLLFLDLPPVDLVTDQTRGKPVS